MLEQLEEALGYRFTNRNLLAEAVTHRSFVNESRDAAIRDNQRFEFLGDAVLGLIVSAKLLELLPGSSEGKLSRIRASLVDECTLASLAEEFDLGRFLLLGKGEEKTGGREKRSVLADAFEALAAAVYLDGGMAAAESFVVRAYGQILTSAAIGGICRDPKTKLQELSQARFGTAPTYQLNEVSGPDHERLFTVSVCVGDSPLGTGAGKSKKEAEQNAARAALLTLDNYQGV